MTLGLWSVIIGKKFDSSMLVKIENKACLAWNSHLLHSHSMTLLGVTKVRDVFKTINADNNGIYKNGMQFFMH